MKLARAKEEEQKTLYFGDHALITCDGCGMVPIVGYRYRCTRCANHDLCETCYDAFAGGKGVKNELAKQVLSSKAEDHAFSLYKDKSFKPLVKGSSAPTKSAPKVTRCARRPPAASPSHPHLRLQSICLQVKPNDPCTCGSGKKFKKCCGCK